MADPSAISASPGPTHALALTPNGTHVLTGGSDKLVKLWNVANGANVLLHTLLKLDAMALQ